MDGRGVSLAVLRARCALGAVLAAFAIACSGGQTGSASRGPGEEPEPCSVEDEDGGSGRECGDGADKN
jgi:hypothetical protein